MHESDYARLRRRLLRDGEIPEELYDELREIVAGLVRRRALPPAFAPYGEWNEEAIDEVFQAWVTRRLIGRSDLRPLVARAGELRIFRSRAEHSLRQFLLNERDRSQAQNLFARLRELLEHDGDFRCFIDARRSQDRWWGLSSWSDPQPFAGPERILHAAGWAAGELSLIRYRADARKLSPLLDLAELKRFAIVVFDSLAALLTVPLVIEALRARVDLDEAPPLAMTEVPEPADPTYVDDLGVRELAVFVRDDLTERQRAVVLATAAGRSLSEIGTTLGCSAATIVNEQRRIAAMITKVTADEDERARLLNDLVDLLYETQ